MFTNILIVVRTFLSIYSFLILLIMLQHVSACIALKYRETGVSNRGRMVPGNWADVIYQRSEHQKFRKSTSF